MKYSINQTVNKILRKQFIDFDAFKVFYSTKKALFIITDDEELRKLVLKLLADNVNQLERCIFSTYVLDNGDQCIIVKYIPLLRRYEDIKRLTQWL